MTLAIGKGGEVPDCDIKLRKRTFFEIRNNQVVRIASTHYANRFKNGGIGIPADDQKEFGDKQFIFKDDPLFARALVQIFFKNVLYKMDFVIEKPDVLATEISKLDIQDEF